MRQHLYYRLSIYLFYFSDFSGILYIFVLINSNLTMNIFQKLTGVIRETINIDTHIDTDAAEKAIRGNIAFLGGPLNYLSELKKRFIETLNLKAENVISPGRSTSKVM